MTEATIHPHRTQRRRGLARRHNPLKATLAVSVAVILIFFFAAPVVWIYWASFKPSAALIGSGGGGLAFTFENYRNVWKNDFGTLIQGRAMSQVIRLTFFGTRRSGFCRTPMPIRICSISRSPPPTIRARRR